MTAGSRLPGARALMFAVSLCAFAASAEVASYRYQMWDRASEPRFAGAVSKENADKGSRYEVETDAAGRVVRVATFRDGKKLSETLRRFVGAAKSAATLDSYLAGELTGTCKVQHGADGLPARMECFTAQGALTRTRVYKYSADGSEELVRDAEGKRISRAEYVYSAAGIIARARNYSADDGSHYESDYDVTTGLVRGRKKVVGGKVGATTTNSYDANGDKTREDLYNETGAWFGAMEYADGQLARKLYKYADGVRKEVRITRDDKRRPKESKQYVNDKLICTFVYDRLPDGMVTRTRALGPDGTLWGEYPRFVNEVRADGNPTDTTHGVVLHRKGSWW